MAICLMLFIILAGPTKTIVFSYSDNLANYFVDMFSLSALNVKKTNNGIMTGHLLGLVDILSPFVGIFIARSQKGEQ